MPELTWSLVALCIAAFFAGAMNSVAGGGTLLTFPSLTSVISEAMANGTSTVALLPGSIAGAVGYRQELWESRRFVVRMLAPSIVGGYVGAALVGYNQGMFAKLVPWLILTAAVLFVVQAPLSAWVKKRAAQGGGDPSHHQPGWKTQAICDRLSIPRRGLWRLFRRGDWHSDAEALGFMGIGDIHRMNAVKTCLAAAINTASVVVFVRDGLVKWELAWPMVIAAIIGGYVGARVARRLPAKYVRYAVIVIGFGLAAFYFIRRYS